MRSVRAWINRYRRGGFGMPEVMLLSLGVGGTGMVVVAVLARLLSLTFAMK